MKERDRYIKIVKWAEKDQCYIPHRTMSEETTKDYDKSKAYVTYCDGIGCNASTKGALKLAKLGFNVKELLGGLDW